jgi:hypothetical protein
MPNKKKESRSKEFVFLEKKLQNKFAFFHSEGSRRQESNQVIKKHQRTDSSVRARFFFLTPRSGGPTVGLWESFIAHARFP